MESQLDGVIALDGTFPRGRHAAGAQVHYDHRTPRPGVMFARHTRRGCTCWGSGPQVICGVCTDTIEGHRATRLVDDPRGGMTATGGHRNAPAGVLVTSHRQSIGGTCGAIFAVVEDQRGRWGVPTRSRSARLSTCTRPTGHMGAHDNRQG